jgi:hypothetical protein
LAFHSAFYILHSAFYILFLFSGLAYAQTTEQQPEERLKSDLPEVIRAEIIDTTQIILEPRSRFNDPSEPRLIHAVSLYAKERLWNLPPILTPEKAARPVPPPPKDYAIRLVAYPGAPKSLFYDLFFAGRLGQTRGFLRVNREQLGDERTKKRGDYNVDGFQGGFSHQYQELSEISLDVGVNLKGLEWLPATAGNPNRDKDLLWLNSDLNWKQQIDETTWSTLRVDLEGLQIDHANADFQDTGADARLNFDMALSWPFLNPIHTGGDVEYFSAKNEQLDEDFWATLFRLYISDQFTLFGPFVLGLKAEGVSFRERNAAGEDKTRAALNPTVTLTTELGEYWRFQFEGQRTTARRRLSELYFDTDYISLNPLLRPEKAWNGQISFRRHRADVEVNASGFARRIGDLVALGRLANAAELTWSPMNVDAAIFGGRLEATARLARRLNVWFQYTVEAHDPEVGDHIPYRPTSYADVDLTYHLPDGFRVLLGGEFRGKRHVDATPAETLGSYLRVKPRLSKTVQDFATVFIGGAFALGDYQMLQGYELSQGNFDFGLELRF